MRNYSDGGGGLDGDDGAGGVYDGDGVDHENGNVSVSYGDVCDGEHGACDRERNVSDQSVSLVSPAVGR